MRLNLDYIVAAGSWPDYEQETEGVIPMAKLLFMGVHGSEDPTNAAMPFIFANGAVSAGHEAQIFIANEVVDLMKQVVGESVMPVGWPAFKEILAETVAHKIAIHV